MASLRIKFPEKDEISVIALTGARITVGRLPANTIQIVDRVISSAHAEFVLEGEHYHLRDLDSTNGTFVNGQFVTDYHLREACKIAFGTVECDFDPAAAATGDGPEVEALPTRAEVNALKKDNEKLITQVAALREELAALRMVRPMTGDEAALGVPKSEYERVTADREALKEAQDRHHQEIARLKENLALLRRDRENLQRAWDITKAELTTYRPVNPGTPVAAAPVAADSPGTDRGESGASGQAADGQTAGGAAICAHPDGGGGNGHHFGHPSSHPPSGRPFHCAFHADRQEDAKAGPIRPGDSVGAAETRRKAWLCDDSRHSKTGCPSRGRTARRREAMATGREPFLMDGALGSAMAKALPRGNFFPNGAARADRGFSEMRHVRLYLTVATLITRPPAACPRRSLRRARIS